MSIQSLCIELVDIDITPDREIVDKSSLNARISQARLVDYVTGRHIHRQVANCALIGIATIGGAFCWWNMEGFGPSSSSFTSILATIRLTFKGAAGPIHCNKLY